MHRSGITWPAVVVAAGIALLAGCAGTDGGTGHTSGGAKDDQRARAPGASPTSGLERIPGVGDRLRSRIPQDARQVVAVYGRGADSAESTVVLWTKQGSTWDRTASWAGHNGKRGWTTDHREGDKRSPVGVFTLSDAGGLLPDPDPGAGLPYDQSPAFTTPGHWPPSHRHDFDYVIAVDYNRVRGTSPVDPTRPQGQSKGGGIWLHLDHGSGTSGCVSLPKSGMTYLLRDLDPARHPVVVMGDEAHLRR
ncbi:L,D-transpeptidase family protein [Streptomyces sp. KR80]|uniref:L,D-transpeptidase family protein n=1 Tax=Streptomyces sp. KR80 TaxID=3457426 RepID=UPI003FD3B149